jgi:hypothetical protein
MPRTQLHSAASGPARTAFHAHRGVGVEEIKMELERANTVVTNTIKGDVAQTQTALTNSIETARAGLSAQVDTAKTEIKDDVTQTQTALTNSIQTARIELGAQVLSVKSDTVNIPPRRQEPVVGRAEFTQERQTQVFECMRVLSQVESLTTDERQNVTQKNRALGRIRNDTSLQSSLNTLPEVLQERARVVQNDFPSAPDDEARERLERFWMIQDLRRTIMAHFAAQPPAAPSSTTAADAPATPDTQS